MRMQLDVVFSCARFKSDYNVLVYVSYTFLIRMVQITLHSETALQSLIRKQYNLHHNRYGNEQNRTV